MNAAVIKGEYPKGQGREAKEAARLVQAELDKLAAISGGNLARFGVRAEPEGVGPVASNPSGSTRM